MPYTPPAQRSPATSAAGSPSISRSHSYAAAHGSQTTSPLTSAPRPSLPRSTSSTAYLQKHRRTPSISDARPEGAKSAQALANGDSSSSDDERGRMIDAMSLQQLEAVLAKIESASMRGHSPTRAGDQALPALTALPPSTGNGVLSPPADGETRAVLTNEARKISHSRSSSDVLQLTMPKRMTAADLPPTHSSDDSDVEDDELRIKPPLLRKKSGELVKPALRPRAKGRRPSSMPGTPTYSKAVHFCEDIEQVRHFLQVDRPIAVSAGSSPVETYESESDFPWAPEDPYSRHSNIVEWEIKTSNFPRDTFERQAAPVRVERIFLSSDKKSLVGTVACANLAFHKLVVARFTLDYWKTTSEVVADYNNDVRRKQANDGYDRFNFNIKLTDQAHLESKTLLLCVRYTVGGKDYWDNNGKMNYQVDFTKKTRPRANANKGGMHAGPLGAIPRSRHSPSPGRNARTQPTSPDDDFVSRIDNSGFHFGMNKKFSLVESPNNTIKLRNHHRTARKGSVYPVEARATAAGAATGPNQAQGFSTRYDFGASLTAALTNAQNVLGAQSGLATSVPKEVQQRQSISAKDFAGPVTGKTVADAPQPAVLSNATEARPGLQSAEYNDLIAKYCFFGSGAASSISSPPYGTPTAPVDPAKGSDGTHDGVHSYNSSATSSVDSSRQSSGSNSPTPVPAPSPFDGSNDSPHHSRTPSGYSSSRSTSPGHFALRSGSPVPFEGQQSFGGSGYGMFEATAQVATHG